MIRERDNLGRSRPTLRSVPGWTALGVLLVVAALALDARAPGERGLLVVTRDNPDSIAYFATAHSLLLDRDVDLANQIDRLRPDRTRLPGHRYLAPQPETGRPGNPYPIGFPLLAMPFVALGTGIDALLGLPANGWGPWSERLFVLVNLPLLVLGLALLARLLADLARRWGAKPPNSRRAALFTALSLPPTTALGYYVLTAMSHTASFFATSLFLALWWPRRDSVRLRDGVVVGAALGLAALCRWQGALLALVPLVADLLRPRAEGRLRDTAWWRSRAAGAVAAAVVFLPQLAAWQATYGSFLLVPQGEDFLVWPPAHALEVLFSSRNGLFFHTPATLVGAAGLIAAAWRFPRLAVPFLAAFAAQVLLVGSLSYSWHGHAFAARLLIDSLPLLAAGLAYALLRSSPRQRAVVVVGLALGAVFTLASAVQWRLDLVPRASRLTFAEAFTDKLRIPGALPRGAAVRASRRASAAGDEARAERILTEARARFGDDRALLRRLRDLHERRRDLGARDRVQRRLDELAERELF